MTPQYKYYKSAKKEIESINEHKEKYVIILYAIGNVGNANRIISIVVQNLGGEPHSFSIDDEMKSVKNKFVATTENFDSCEKKLLKRFYDFAQKQCNDKIWLHWRMKLANYSFSALENRYIVLGGTNPFTISDRNKIDICETFKKRYGENFVDKSKHNQSSWRITYIAQLNNIETAGFLEYTDEIGMLNNNQYDAILTSLSRKISIVTQMLDLSYKNKLKTDSKWKDIYGISIQGIYEVWKDKWWFNLILFALGIFLGLILKK